MQRLIDDANEYRATIGETSDLSIDSFADIVAAIQSVQEAQGIAGTTAKEAMTTIEGSAAATSAAWQNVLTAIAGGGDLKEAMDGLIFAIFGENEGEGLLANIIPRIQTTLEGIAEFIGQAAPLFSAKLPELIEAIVPALISSAISLVAALVAQLPTILQALWNALISGIQSAIPAVMQAFQGMNTESISTLLSNVPNMLSTGVDWITNIVLGMVNEIPNVITTLGTMINNMIIYIVDNFPAFLQKGVEIIMKLVDGLVQATPSILNSLVNIIVQLIGKLGESLPQFLQKGIEIIGELIVGLLEAIPDLLAAIPQIIDNAVEAFGQFDWSEIGKNIIDGIVNGLVNFGGMIWDTLSNIAQDAWDNVCGFFGIASPSKKFRDGVGKQLMLGMAEGVEQNNPTQRILGTIKDVLTDAESAAENADLFVPIESEFSVRGTVRTDTEQKLNDLLDMCNEYFPLFAKVKVMLDTGAMVGEMLPDIDEGLAERLDFANAG